MSRTEPRFIALAVALAALAGFVDALAYTSFGSFFASFMSGNSTRLGVEIGSGTVGNGVMAGALIMCFIAGVILASVVGRAWEKRRQPAVLMLVTALLLAAAALAMVRPGAQVLLLLAAAMGAENGMFERDGEVTIGVTYMTGSIVRMGQKLAHALMGDKDRWAWGPWLLLWLGFVGGVVLGAWAQADMQWNALWLAVIAAAVLTGIAALIGKTGQDKVRQVGQSQ
ncbi:YoaK family protein [Stakelama tenebrarum]|uniref:DUF1275 domain-containing protein n=1 Tax=Stakelama tenebrarum TaxID=2711215 RepID=A0A6G6Y984_9SPHN|nr:YoaK family protein [Sphingosinithalassobacter tenebrarum]QIG81479.1 DUF1275 domain-containing protein [Sphingosinithalassobacter tenebrarum]